MKRTLTLLALFLLMGGGAYFAYQYQKKTKSGSNISPDMDFAIEDPSKIYKIFLADRNGKTATLNRKGDRWMYNNQYPARQTAVDRLLETMKKVKVWYVPPEAAEPTMIKSVAAEGIKVETYDQDGKIIKIYYVGGVTNDESGTFMMMEGAEHPYITHIPTMIGSVRIHYRLDPDDWYDRTVFEEKPENIQSVSVEYPQNRSESFKLDKIKAGEYAVNPFYSTTPTKKAPQVKGYAEAYLINFEKLGAEAHETNNPLRDSVTALVPFAIVTLKNEKGEEKVVRFWPIEQIEQPGTGKIFNIRYLTDCSWGPFMLTQHHVFGPIFRGYSHFFGEHRNSNPIVQ
jgi:hypothetical protein